MSWVFGNPPGASPDEPAALVKALATAHLELSGKPYTAPLPPYTLPSGMAWINKATRSYGLPSRQAPATLTVCTAFAPNQTAGCLLHQSVPTRPRVVQAPTPDGVYPPFLYLPLGLAARLASSLNGEFYAARLASGGISIVLLATATWCTVIRRRSLWPAAGLALAATPMVIFLDASVTTNGMEIAAAICFWAALFRLRQPDAPQVAWLAFGAGGALMCLARQLDVAWLVTGAVVFVCLTGPDKVFDRARRGGRYSIVGLCLAAGGGLAGIAWDVFATPSQPISLTIALNNKPTPYQLRELAHQAVGVFGWLDTPLPAPAEQAWFLAIGIAACVALVVGTSRQRVALVGTCVAVAAATVGVQLFVMDQIGYGMQMRYVLAMAVAVPLLSAEIISERNDARKDLAGLSRVLLFGVMVIVSVVQWVAYYTNAHRYAVGLDSPRSLLTQAAWQPPGGTVLWLVVTGTGVAFLAIAGALIGKMAGLGQPPTPVSARLNDKGNLLIM